MKTLIYKIKKFFINHRIKSKKSIKLSSNNINCNIIYYNDFINMDSRIQNTCSNIVVLFTYSIYNINELVDFYNLLNNTNIKSIFKITKEDNNKYLLLSGNIDDYINILLHINDINFEDNKFILKLRNRIMNIIPESLIINTVLDPNNEFKHRFIDISNGEDLSNTIFNNLNIDISEDRYEYGFKDSPKYFNTDLLLDKNDNYIITSQELEWLCNLYYIIYDKNNNINKDINPNIIYLDKNIMVYKFDINKDIVFKAYINNIIQSYTYTYTKDGDQNQYNIFIDLYYQYISDDDISYTNDINSYYIHNIKSNCQDPYLDIDEIL